MAEPSAIIREYWAVTDKHGCGEIDSIFGADYAIIC
jgi:hypothetical protein